jgi:hypothetical protein
LPLPRSPSSAASSKRGDRKEKNKRRRETRRRGAVAKATAKERERPQITVATVIQKPGQDVKKKGVNMKDKSKESQVLDVLKKYMPRDKLILAMFDELMTIMRKGGTQRERRKTIGVQREEKAVEDVKVAAEAQKAAKVERLIAVERAIEDVKAAEAQKAAEDVEVAAAIAVIEETILFEKVLASLDQPATEIERLKQEVQSERRLKIAAEKELKTQEADQVVEVKMLKLVVQSERRLRLAQCYSRPTLRKAGATLLGNH